MPTPHHEPPPRGALFDLDGTLYEAGALIPGADRAVAAIREAGLPVLFITNTTRKPRSELARRLTEYGIPAERKDVLNAPFAAANWLEGRSIERVLPLLAPAALEDLDGVRVDRESPEAVLVGDLGRDLEFDALDEAFRALMAGAELVALQKNRYWKTSRGLSLDAGAFVAALEFSSGKAATVVGKPTAAFFQAALDRLALPPEEVVMVGDDLEADIDGARALGMQTVALRTGKYRPEEDAARASAAATAVLDSVADLPNWIGIG